MHLSPLHEALETGSHVSVVGCCSINGCDGMHTTCAARQARRPPLGTGGDLVICTAKIAWYGTDQGSIRAWEYSIFSKRLVKGLRTAQANQKRDRQREIVVGTLMDGDVRCEEALFIDRVASRPTEIEILCLSISPYLHIGMLCRRFGKQLAVIIEPALPFVGHAATSAAAFTVGMGLSQV